MLERVGGDLLCKLLGMIGEMIEDNVVKRRHGIRCSCSL